MSTKQSKHVNNGIKTKQKQTENVCGEEEEKERERERWKGAMTNCPLFHRNFYPAVGILRRRYTTVFSYETINNGNRLKEREKDQNQKERP
jgi:hypothetical protein